MPITDRGACEWFVWDLRRSSLIDRGQIDQLVNDFLKKQPGAEPPALAQYLVNQGFLSAFQAERLLQGKTQGMVLGPFTLTDTLGSGSMGTVYKALSKNDNRWYAVKVLPRRSMWNVRIARRQVRAFEKIQHPAVVPFVDVGTSGGTHYLVWPLIEGETLENLVNRMGTLPCALAARYALQTAEGLEHCHQQGLIHGLLKPSNLMIGPDQHVRILDFGIGALLAETEGESLVDTMSTANTLTSGLDCSSPESIMEPTNRTAAGDQYSLGCILYFCLTGRYPFAEETAVTKMLAHQTKQPPAIRQFNPEVPDALLEVINQLMQKAPEARFPSFTEVIKALTPLANSPLPTARPAARPLFVSSVGNGQGPLRIPPADPMPSAGTAPSELPRREPMKVPVSVGSPVPVPDPVSPPEAIPLLLQAKPYTPPGNRISMAGFTFTVTVIGIFFWMVWTVMHH